MEYIDTCVNSFRPMPQKETEAMDGQIKIFKCPHCEENLPSQEEYTCHLTTHSETHLRRDALSDQGKITDRVPLRQECDSKIPGKTITAKNKHNVDLLRNKKTTSDNQPNVTPDVLLPHQGPQANVTSNSEEGLLALQNLHTPVTLNIQELMVPHESVKTPVTLNCGELLSLRQELQGNVNEHKHKQNVVLLRNKKTMSDNQPNGTPNYRPRSEGDNVLGSVRLSVCPSVRPSVSALTAEPFDLRP